MQKMILLFCLIFWAHPSYSAIAVDTVWESNVVITDPLLEKLIESDVIQRLKFIDQSGPLYYFHKSPQFTRYEHSVGVLVLLQKADTSLKEQVAGLLHDASHTAFSHVGDHLLHQHNQEESYQDSIHLDYLEEAQVETLVSPYGMTLEDLDPDRYSALEQPIPDLCADRLQYVVHTGVLWNKISTEEAEAIIQDLSFENEKWFFHSKDLARKFSDLSLHFTPELWGSPWNFVFYEYFSEVLKRAIELEIISMSDIKIGKDQEIMNSLRHSTDPFISEGLKNLENIDNIFSLTDFGQGDLNVKPKFRGINPLIKTDDKLQYLSEIDEQYAQNFENVQIWCQKGFGIKMLVPFKGS